MIDNGQRRENTSTGGQVGQSKCPCVLRLRPVLEPAEAVQRWKGQLNEFQTHVCEKFFGIDGEPIEFDWHIFPRRTSLELLHKIQEYLESRNKHHEKFGDRNIFMSMFNDIIWDKKNNDQECVSNSDALRNSAKIFLSGPWIFTEPGSEERWCASYVSKAEENWNSMAGQMLQRFVETGHPIFKGTSSLNRGVFKRKNIKNAIHFNAESSNVELLSRIISLCKSAQCPRSCVELELTGTVLQVLSQFLEISSKAKKPVTKKQRRV